MKIFYDSFTKEWLSYSDVTLGTSEKALNTGVDRTNKNLVHFTVKCKENNAGPIIGILTGRGKDHSLAGNGPLFIELQKELIKNSGISVVFTAEGIKGKEIDGFMYLPETRKWLPVTCPLPHLVYNRVPFRKLENTDTFKTAFQFFQKKSIPFFNPLFLDKYQVYDLLKGHPLLRQYMPETILVNDKEALHDFLEEYGKLYLKPVQGAKGKGIYRISLLSDQSIEMAGIKQTSIHKDFDFFWSEREPMLRMKSYLAQEAITPLLLKGKRFDFRILAHFIQDSFQVTGVGIRQSVQQEITTHIPNGGIIIPYKQIQTAQHDKFIESTVKEAGQLLLEKKGFFGEFSIDAGITDQGKYIIYEINSKPMKFDEKEIENKRIQTLSRLFFNMTEFPY